MYNLVYIHTHDTGRSISPYGYSCQSDNLLALAREATLFTHAYSCAPTCSPSRAAMLTGQLPHQTGMLGLAHRGFFLTQPRHHLANYLASQGYHTVISGVQHEHGRYTDLDPEGLNRLGYQEILTVSAQDKPCYVAWDRQNALRAACWIRENDDEKPFFLAYGMNATVRIRKPPALILTMSVRPFRERITRMPGRMKPPFRPVCATLMKTSA